MHHINKKLIATFVFSIFASIIAIVHGVFFDLDISSLERLSWAGFILTFIIIFASLLILEWVFDMKK